jgi:hypothetical protein
MIVIARSEATKQSSRAPAGALNKRQNPLQLLRIFVCALRARWIASLCSQ